MCEKLHISINYGGSVPLIFLQVCQFVNLYTFSVEVQFDIEGVLLKLLYKVYHIKV